MHAQLWQEAVGEYPRACQQHSQVLWSIPVLASSLHMDALPVPMLKQVPLEFLRSPHESSGFLRIPKDS